MFKLQFDWYISTPFVNKEGLVNRSKVLLGLRLKILRVFSITLQLFPAVFHSTEATILYDEASPFLATGTAPRDPGDELKCARTSICHVTGSLGEIERGVRKKGLRVGGFFLQF